MTTDTSATRVPLRRRGATGGPERTLRIRGRDVPVRGLLPLVVLVVGMAVNATILVLHSSRVWFWADDWDLLFLRGTIPKYDVGLFEPHNNHWFTGHILTYRALFSLFGMRSYTPYAVAEICYHLAIVALLYAVLRRVAAGRWVAVLAALLVAFFGLGANAEIYAASMNHAGALLFGLVAVLLVARGDLDRRDEVIASGALLVSIMFGLTGLAMFALVGAFLLQRHGWRKAVRVVGPPTLVFVAWLVLFGRHTGVNSVDPPTDLTSSVPKIPSYVWTGLTGTLGDGSGLTGAGPLLVIGLLAGLVLYRGANPLLLQLAWAGVVADLFQLTIVGVARYAFGPEQLGTSHYSYINIVLLTPAVALVGTQLARRLGEPRWRAALLAALLFVAYALNGITSVQKWQDDFTTLTGGGQNIALGIKAGLANGQRVLTDRNPDEFNKQLIPKYVGTPQILAALPDRKPSRDGQLSADSYFFTGVGVKDYKLANPTTVTPFAGFAPVTLKRGCQSVQSTAAEPILEVDTGTVGTEIVVWSDSTVIKTRLVRGKAEGPTMSWKAKPGAMHIATSAPDATMYVSFNGSGRFTLCVA